MLKWRTPPRHPFPEQFLSLWLIDKERIRDYDDHEGPAVGEQRSLLPFEPVSGAIGFHRQGLMQTLLCHGFSHV